MTRNSFKNLKSNEFKFKMEKKLFNYNIIKILGEGGMSRVYLGEDSITHQQVAIKELLPNLTHSQDLRERFRREAQIMAKLDHPNIVKLIRYEETATSFYLIMEYVDGMDLEQHIKEVTGPVSEPKAIEIMSTLLDALGYAHEKGVVHRDIKPANILITRDGKIKVLDFGIAKIVDENASGRTQTGTRIGTVAYMSPEQVNAAPNIDLRTDIYSLGVMLHQMITGKTAYDTATSSDFEVQTLIVKEPLPRACSIYPYASDHLQKLIDKATQKKRENRFQDCDQFKLELFKKNQKNLPPPPKNKNQRKWVGLFIILASVVGMILITNNNVSNSDNEYIYNGNYRYKTYFDNPLFEKPLRARADHNSTEIYSCPKNSAVYVIDVEGVDFIKVNVDGYEGYISRSSLIRND
jgi:serine/threonine protein kinase